MAIDGMFRLAMVGEDVRTLPWAWTESLAVARPGASYRVSSIPTSIARDHCGRAGCREGELLTCTSNTGGTVVLERADGRKLLLTRRLAWYVQAEICEMGGARPN
jgi:hypothetical protein